jgi:hypothetical protein
VRNRIRATQRQMCFTPWPTTEPRRRGAEGRLGAILVSAASDKAISHVTVRFPSEYHRARGIAPPVRSQTNQDLLPFITLAFPFIVLGLATSTDGAG